MQNRYLEITFRRGKPLAAYLYLAREPGVRSSKTRPAGRGLVLDYGPDDRLIGIEITAPRQVTLQDLNVLLAQHRLAALTQEEVMPLMAA